MHHSGTVGGRWLRMDRSAARRSAFEHCVYGMQTVYDYMHMQDYRFKAMRCVVASLSFFIVIVILHTVTYRTVWPNPIRAS